MLLRDLPLFLHIVEKGSLVAAARETGLSSTTVSERLAALEQHYGVTLLNRTTRAISLTDEGRELMEGARRVLGEVEDLDNRIRLGADALSGPIRISAPRDLGRTVVRDEIDRFLNHHPTVSIEVVLSDGYIDIVSEGLDLALRFGPVTDSTLRSRNVGAWRRVVCAAPRYLDQHGTPELPTDLQHHNCLVMRFGRVLDNVWQFGSGRPVKSVTVRGNRIADDGELVRQWGIAGHGVILKSELDVNQDIQSGRLIEILSAYAPPPLPLQLMYPPGRAQPRRVRALAEQLFARFRSEA